VLTAEYHLKQAEIAARLALAEADPKKAAAFHVMTLEHFAKAEKAKLKEPAPNGQKEAPSTGRG
jgi:hypothetical protein